MPTILLFFKRITISYNFINNVRFYLSSYKNIVITQYGFFQYSNEMLRLRGIDWVDDNKSKKNVYMQWQFDKIFLLNMLQQ